MSYEIVFTSSFKRSVKRLKKRYPRVKQDVSIAIKILLNAPRLGVVIPGGSGSRKLRLKKSNLARGKSGGYRLIYYVEEMPIARISLLLLYAKSDTETINRRELQRLLDEMAVDNET